MSTDPFEQKLREQPLRQAPDEWRGAILQAARAARAGGEEPDLPWWRGWLQPGPRAWAALAAVWVVILALNTASREARPQPQLAGNPAPANVMTFAENRELLNRLLESPQETPVATEPKPGVTGPRSQRRETVMTA